MPTLPQLLHDLRLQPQWRKVFALLALGVAVAALTPGSGAPSLGTGDKLDHVLAFVALALTGTLAWRATARRLSITAALLVVYGAAIELAQTRVPGRQCEVADLVADTLGVAAGIGLACALRRHWPAPKT